MAKDRYHTSKAVTSQPGLSGYVQHASRRLLATDGPSIAPLFRYGRPQSAVARAGTILWNIEQALHRLIDRHPAGAQRALDIIPGLTAWVLILTPFLLAYSMPIVPIGLAVLLQIYWFGRGLGALVFGSIGYARIRAHTHIDWRARYDAERAAGKHVLPWSRVRHIVIISNYNEPVGKLRATLAALAAQREVAGQIYVVLAMEEREEGAAEKAEALLAEFQGRLGDIRYTVHPAGLPGEAAVKAANETWAARWARQHYVDELGHDIQHITLTSCDVDSVFHPSYFACLTYKFAADPRRRYRIWQAPVLFHNNIWQVPTFIQLLVMPAGVWFLADLVSQSDDLFPFSTYSLSLATIDGAGYWDTDVISDDWHIYFACFFRYRGQINVEPIYLPVSADAPQSPTLVRTAINRYEQAKRHAWGVRDVSYAVKMYFQHAEIPVRVKLPLVWLIARHHLIWAVSWFVLTFGVAVPTLVNPAIAVSGPTSVLCKFFALAGVIMAILSPGLPVVDMLLRPRRPKDRRWWQDVWACLQWTLMPLTMLIFGALPAIDAQTRLMLGEELGFRVTEKI